MDILLLIIIILMIWLATLPANIMKRKGYTINTFLSVVIFFISLSTGVLYGIMFALLIPFNTSKQL